MNQREVLNLPARATALWRETRDAVRAGVAELTGEPKQYAIGGGSILAARWQHRASYDIDIMVPADTSPGAVLGSARSDFRQRIERLGATVTAGRRGQLVTASWPGVKVELWGTTPMPRSGSREAVVDGDAEVVLSTTQILRGKLERGEDCLVRDVYDVLQAAKLDRKSLVGAVSAAGRNWTMTIAGIWRAANSTISARAETLNTTDPVSDPERLGSDAGDVLRNALYKTLEIGADEDGIVIRGTTGFGPETPIRIQGETDAAFDALGLNDYLKGQRPDARLIRLTAEQRAADAGAYTPIYRESNGETVDWTPHSKEAPPVRPAAAGKPTQGPPGPARNR